VESGSETAKSLLSAVGGVVAKAAEKLSHAMLNMGDTVNVEVRGQHTHKREEYMWKKQIDRERRSSGSKRGLAMAVVL
jgi:hypothetical protein